MGKSLLPGVSVLIRAHLDSPYLFEALKSVGDQTKISKFEVLLCLDRPTAILYGQIDRFRREYPHIVISLVEVGSVGTAERLNILIEFANFELLAILDSDDRMIKDRLSFQIEYMQQNPHVAVVGSAINIIDENGKTIGQKGFTTEPDSITQGRWKNLPVAHPSVMMRKSVIIGVGGYRDFYFPSEDYDLWLRVLETSHIGNLSDVLTDYRVHANQTTASRLFRNVSAGIASRKSAKQRIKNKSELHELYTSSIHWALTSPLLLIVTRRVIRTFAWYRISGSSASLKPLWACLFLCMSPFRGSVELYRKIQQRLDVN
jgi:glycosyltransferase involved in cell wall biosynthesis